MTVAYEKYSNFECRNPATWELKMGTGNLRVMLQVFGIRL